ncbi:MAG: RibD family protein [Alphaproteobacteria bacterium]|nr:RibD family protein [Alphaproteobacteria bacterium]MBU1525864.1 RibD family protein [Alphaproteobacteria bacterium]MBU2117878.1 RibD family protein [Alphaproteobacteria bacterium]MBU2350461.1 RibD family protein [Alphaproteobacteria bacterium]MBU2381063.1 RibD family protein [Alphaproteobacteria bacterium]
MRPPVVINPSTPPTSVRVTLKLATSLDGRIATASGESKWITGEASREHSHWLRDGLSAILVGVETVLADDPDLTFRNPWNDRDKPEMDGQPLRVVLDSRLRTPSSARVARGGTLILTSTHAQPVGGAEVEQIDADTSGRPSIEAVLDALLRRGIGDLVIEGGGQVAASFLRAGRVDVIHWYRSPIILGGDGRPCVAALELANLADAPKFRRLGVQSVGDDLWERYEALR